LFVLWGADENRRERRADADQQAAEKRGRGRRTPTGEAGERRRQTPDLSSPWVRSYRRRRGCATAIREEGRVIACSGTG